MQSTIKPLYETVRMTFKEKTQGGIPALLLGYAMRALYLGPLLLLWRSFLRAGVDSGGMTLVQMLTYTYMSSLLGPLLNVQSPATGWLYEGLMVDLYKRPMGIFPQLIAATVGTWMPHLVLYLLPMLFLSPLFGVSIWMQTPWFFLCLLLCVSLGFAIDFLFACMMIYVKNSSYQIQLIRMGIIALFSGAVIPFDLLPFGLGGFLKLLPFASLAGAPLAVYTGINMPMDVIPLQILWNFLLWPLVIYLFTQTRERMVSYGG